MKQVQVQIQAFASTIKNDECISATKKSADELRKTASQLRRAGFYKEAKDYEKRAERVEHQAHKADMDRKFSKAEKWKSKNVDRPEFIKRLNAGWDAIAKLPHIASVKEHPPKRKLLVVGPQDRSVLLPASMHDKLMQSRDAAWHYHKTGGVS